jgi:hypothetical protein
MRYKIIVEAVNKEKGREVKIKMFNKSVSDLTTIKKVIDALTPKRKIKKTKKIKEPKIVKLKKKVNLNPGLLNRKKVVAEG